MWLPSFGKVFVFKGHWKMLSQPKSFRERETEMCALSVSSWFLSQWGAAWKQSFPPCDSHLQYIYIYIIYKCQYTNKKVSPKLIEEAFRQITLQVRKEEGWQGSIHWTKRLSILTKGCFPKMTVPTLSSLPASVAQNYSFRDPTDFREWIHGSLNLYITCSCWILAICL